MSRMSDMAHSHRISTLHLLTASGLVRRHCAFACCHALGCPLSWGSGASGVGLELGERGVGVDVSAGGSGSGGGMDLSLGDRSSGPETSGLREEKSADGSLDLLGDGPDLGPSEQLELPDAGMAGPQDPVGISASPAAVTVLAEASGESRRALVHRCAEIILETERYEVSLVA